MHHLCVAVLGKYVDASWDPEDVVADLEGLLQHISGLGEALGMYNQYLALFDAATDDLSTLMMAEKEANSRYQVWPPPECCSIRFMFYLGQIMVSDSRWLHLAWNGFIH